MGFEGLGARGQGLGFHLTWRQEAFYHGSTILLSRKRGEKHENLVKK